MISVDTLPRGVSNIMLDYLKLKDRSNFVSISRFACCMLNLNKEWQEFNAACSLKAIWPVRLQILTDCCFKGVEGISELCLSYLYSKQAQIQYKKELAQEINQFPPGVLDALGGINKYVDMPIERNASSLAYPRLTSFMGDQVGNYPSIKKGIDSHRKLFFVFRYSSREGEKMLTVLRQDPENHWEWKIAGYTSFSKNCQGWDLFRNADQRYLSNAGLCIQNLLQDSNPYFKFAAPNLTRSKDSWAKIEVGNTQQH